MCLLLFAFRASSVEAKSLFRRRTFDLLLCVFFFLLLL